MKGAVASTITTPIERVAYACDRYSKDNNGAVPANWNQLKRYLNMTILDGEAGGSAEKRIAIVRAPTATESVGEAVVAVTTNAISEDIRDGLGRYIIWKKKGTYHAEREKEEVVKQYFIKHGLTLPEGGTYLQPDELPEITIQDATEPMKGSRRSNSAGQITTITPASSAISHSTPTQATALTKGTSGSTQAVAEASARFPTLLVIGAIVLIAIGWMSWKKLF
jgi:hypothetical protein